MRIVAMSVWRDDLELHEARLTLRAAAAHDTHHAARDTVCRDRRRRERASRAPTAPQRRCRGQPNGLPPGICHAVRHERHDDAHDQAIGAAGARQQ